MIFKSDSGVKRLNKSEKKFDKNSRISTAAQSQSQTESKSQTESCKPGAVKQNKPLFQYGTQTKQVHKQYSTCKPGAVIQNQAPFQ